MIKKDIVYRNFNGEEKTTTAYFNLTEAELVALDTQFGEGGLEKKIREFDPINRPDEILKVFETVIKKAYGTRSEDGEHFFKTEVRTERFMQSAAYSAFFVSLLTDSDRGVEFFTNVASRTKV
jgi:hypothetical protein